MSRQIGHYRVLRELGKGGMGEVFLGVDDILGRQVAIKTVRAALLGDGLAQARFLREARAVAALSHPNIATVFEAGQTDDGPFLVMEYLEGETLTELRARGRIPMVRVLGIAKQLARALAHAHSRHVLHRDVKGSNAMLTQDGTVKLLDFGLAQMEGGGELSTLTVPGSFVGTVHYGAPEVLTGGQATAQSDLYSLGVLMYSLASGRLPFEGLGGASLLGAILHGEPEAPSEWNAEVPGSIDALILHAMARDRAGRFESAQDLLDALAALSEETPEPAVMPAPVEVGAGLAVLPFESLSTGEDVDWLGTGLAETLSVELGRLNGLRMIGRERVGVGLAISPDPVAFGRAVGAEWVVSGAFQRVGDRLRITFRLVSASSGSEVLQDKLDGAWDQVFELQDQVARTVAGALEKRTEPQLPPKAPAAEVAKLEAYELYARGLREFLRLEKTAMEAGREYLARAVEADPEYAMAYATLGGVDAMRYIHRSDPDDLNRALRSLERAVALDPELAEPYPWLAYVHSRQGHVEEAIRAGRRGVALQPDLGRAHYFLGVAELVQIEFGVNSYQAAVGTLLDATIADPEWSPSWLGLSDAALRLGKVEAARSCAERAVRLERDELATQRTGKPRGRNRGLLQGGTMMLAWIAAREGNVDQARTLHAEAIELARQSDHMYREQFMAQSTLGLAELDRRSGFHHKALALYRRAWQMAGEFTSMLGGERLLVRAQAGMAGTYAMQGEVARAHELLGGAARRYVELPPQNWFWGVSLAQLSLDLASANMLVGDLAGALESLRESVRMGWGDEAWLRADPELASLREDEGHAPSFEELCLEIRDKSELRFEPAGRTIEGLTADLS